MSELYLAIIANRECTLQLRNNYFACLTSNAIMSNLRNKQVSAHACRGLQIGMVFQSGALFDSLTVGENVGFLLYEHSQLPEERIKVRKGLNRSVT